MTRDARCKSKAKRIGGQGPKGRWDVLESEVYPSALPKGRYEGGKTQNAISGCQFLWALSVAPSFSLSGLPSDAMLVFGLFSEGMIVVTTLDSGIPAFSLNPWFESARRQGILHGAKIRILRGGKSDECFRFSKHCFQ